MIHFYIEGVLEEFLSWLIGVLLLNYRHEDTGIWNKEKLISLKVLKSNRDSFKYSLNSYKSIICLDVPHESICLFQSVSEDEDDDLDDFNSDISISPSAIQRALQFQTPVKSSLKSANNIFSKLRNVRFDVTDSASLSSSPV